MNPRIIVLAVAAVLVAGLTAFLARQFLLDSTPTQETQAPKETTEILVAARNLPQGHIVEAGDLAWAEWPNDGLHPNYFNQESITVEDLAGFVVRFGIVGGEPITRGRIVGPGAKGFIAAVLSPGMRAVTLPVNRVSGLAGLVFPGDRVDLILTRVVRDQRGIPHRTSETVLKNIRILAVDVRVDDQAKGNPALGKSVTVEVSPKMAEKVTMLRSMGRISLALRSLSRVDSQGVEIYSPEDDMPVSNAQTVTWDAEVSTLSRPVNPPVERLVISRGRSNQVYRIQGTDVLGEEDPVFADEEGRDSEFDDLNEDNADNIGGDGGQ